MQASVRLRSLALPLSGLLMMYYAGMHAVAALGGLRDPDAGLNLLPSDMSGVEAIELGCGTAYVSGWMARRGARVTAIDMAEAPLAVARLHLKKSGMEIDYLRETAESHAAANAGAYDIVTCLEMLEHVPDPSSIVRSCAQLVRPGGDVFFSTINRNPKSFVFAIVGAEYILQLLPKGTHEYDKFIRPSELEEWARRAGLTLKTSIGLHYNPLTREYTLGPNLDVNYLMHYQRPESE